VTAKNDDMERARIAVAGAGMIGLRHIEEIGGSRSARLASIVDPSPGAAAIAQREDVPLFASIAELLAHDRPDGVILATPNRLHVEQGLACVAAGIPTLVEKPVGHSYVEALRLCEAAERANVPVLVGHHRRHSPILHKAVAIVQSGVLGRLVGVIGSAVFYKPDGGGYFDGPNAWRRQPGGGPVLLNMIHEVGNLRAMVGEIVQVQAFASSEIRGFPVEDTVAVNLRFDNGALGTFLLSDTAASPKSWEQTSGENKAYASYPDEDAYTVIGTDGSLAIPTMRLKTYARKQDRSWFNTFDERIEHVEREDPLALQIEHFVAVIRGSATPLVTCRDGLRNLRVTDAILEAARTGTTVDAR
jgi:predicted dehydrogenase